MPSSISMQELLRNWWFAIANFTDDEVYKKFMEYAEICPDTLFEVAYYAYVSKAGPKFVYKLVQTNFIESSVKVGSTIREYLGVDAKDDYDNSMQTFLLMLSSSYNNRENGEKKGSR